MKKILILGTICLGMGMASCKTYCPAYSSIKVDKETTKDLSTTRVAVEKSAS